MLVKSLHQVLFGIGVFEVLIGLGLVGSLWAWLERFVFLIYIFVQFSKFFRLGLFFRIFFGWLLLWGAGEVEVWVRLWGLLGFLFGGFIIGLCFFDVV